MGKENGQRTIEKQIIEGSETHAPPADIILGLFRFDQIQGMRFLEIGSGASDAVCKLVQQGADAYAVDPIFARKLGQMRAGHKRHMKKLLTEAREMVEEYDESFKIFSKFLKEQPHRNIAASAANLPFANDTFDYVYSANSIASIFVQDLANLFYPSLDEAIRVAKIGGLIQLFPIFEDGILDAADRLTELAYMFHHNELGDHLSERTDIEIVGIETPYPNEKHTLILQKVA